MTQTEFELGERHSRLLLAKLRSEQVLKDNVVFNNVYEGNPVAGSVKIPVRDEEVLVGDYDKTRGISQTGGSSTYRTELITKDKAINELIDGHDAAAVPDNLVADRLDSAGYVFANIVDEDGATALLAGGTIVNKEVISIDNAYTTIVDIRRDMTKANIPSAGRYLLATPDFYSLLLKDTTHFVRASELGDDLVQTGALGRIAGFTVYEWNDSTAGLAFICGHPRFATRVIEMKTAPYIADLSNSEHYVNACAIKGRIIYDHFVLRKEGVMCVFSPEALCVTQVSYENGYLTVDADNVPENTTLLYRVNPRKRAMFGEILTDGSELELLDTEIECNKGDSIEIVAVLSDDSVAAVGYLAVN